MPESVIEFRWQFLIYCLNRLPDGSYIALNRDYKPLGFPRQPFVEYETAPGRFKFKRALSQDQIAALSYKGDTSAERIYLYNDGCVPTRSASAWRDYSARLERLAGYRIVPAA